jgi:CTP:molybdopterin cytidylyltransferase MocA
MMKHAGLVLAAGASTRMGRPKALLLTPAGAPLAQHQATLLRDAGCDEVLVVLGSDFESIAKQIPNCRTVRNPDWNTGRFSSIQAGLRALHSFDGCFILPVDTVGVSLRTLEVTRDFADQEKPVAVRPTFKRADGKIAWISKQLAADIANAETADTRLDLILREKSVRLPVEDPAILNNVNTPEEWKDLKWQT